MPDFRFSARDVEGRGHKGVLAAAHLAELEQTLRARNLYLVDAREVAVAAARAAGRVRDVSLSRRRMIDFTNQLETSYSAGVPVTQALDDFSREDDDRQFAEILGAVRQRIVEGSTLAESLEAFPKAFPRLYTSLVHAGERTGTLDRILRDLVGFLEWQDELVSQVRAATIYPVVILTATAGLVTLLFGYVLPKFFGVFASLRLQLPLPTRVLIATCTFVQNHVVHLLVGAAVVVAAVVVGGHTRRGRWFLDTVKLVLPIYGKLARKLALSRIAHNLSMMLSAGMEIAASLTMTEQLLGNVVMSKVVSKAREQIVAGEAMSTAFGDSPYVPRALVRHLSVGEATGRMTQALERISQQFDREIPRAVKQFFAILEPAILVALGGVVAFVALSLFMPLYELQAAITR